MLEALFGNKNVMRVLLFLFVNSKCYGTELAMLFKAPLTPLQKALQRLEKGGILTSYYQGKTRIYEFSPTFTLMEELEQLLKKAYTHLPPQEKKYYCFVKRESYTKSTEEKEQRSLIDEVWKKLGQVQTITFHAKTKTKEANNNGMFGKGKGDVVIAGENNSLTFTEKGSWKTDGGKEISFSNVFRWTLDRDASMISLEHLRRGKEHPVFLFHLVPTSTHALTSLDAHLCKGDSYFGELAMNEKHLQLHVRVIGPKKNEEMDYYYS